MNYRWFDLICWVSMLYLHILPYWIIFTYIYALIVSFGIVVVCRISKGVYSFSTDWLPTSDEGLFLGIETGLLSGQTQGHSIYGIPAILRIGWSLNNLVDVENSHFFLLGKIGWGL